MSIWPAFAADCLETLEEIGLRGKKTFLRAGGEVFTMIPCFYEHTVWIGVLENLAAEFRGAARGSRRALPRKSNRLCAGTCAKS